jgi:phage-related protein
MAQEDEYSIVDTVKSASKTQVFNDLDEHEGLKAIFWEREAMHRFDLVSRVFK